MRRIILKRCLGVVITLLLLHQPTLTLASRQRQKEAVAFLVVADIASAALPLWQVIAALMPLGIRISRIAVKRTSPFLVQRLT